MIQTNRSYFGELWLTLFFLFDGHRDVLRHVESAVRRFCFDAEGIGTFLNVFIGCGLKCQRFVVIRWHVNRGDGIPVGFELGGPHLRQPGYPYVHIFIGFAFIVKEDIHADIFVRGYFNAGIFCRHGKHAVRQRCFLGIQRRSGSHMDESRQKEGQDGEQSNLFPADHLGSPCM